MVDCSSRLRKLGDEATSMEESADLIVRYIFDSFVDRQTGERSFALVRFFKTIEYRDLLPEMVVSAKQVLVDASLATPEMKCLTMLATAGLKTEWQSRTTSVGHQAIPLPSTRFVERFPMVRQLVQQLGMDVNTILRPDPDVLADMSLRTYNVFYIPEADGSRYVPAQEDFVRPYGIRSVLGFGGMLPSGNIYTIIMFARTFIPRESADLFKTLALSIKVAILPFYNRVFRS